MSDNYDLLLIGVWFLVCSDIAKHLSLPPVKLHCSMLAEDAIKAAVKDYQSKKDKKVADESPSRIAAVA